MTTEMKSIKKFLLMVTVFIVIIVLFITVSGPFSSAARDNDKWHHISYLKLDKPYRGWQGVVSDEKYYYVVTDRDERFKFSDIIEVYSNDGTLIKTVRNAYTRKDATGHFMSFGSPSIIDGKLYVTAYNCNSGGKPYISRVAVYSLTTLKLERDINLGANIAENIVYHNGYYWVCFFDKMIMKKYSPVFKLLKVYSFSRKMEAYGGYQGIIWDGNSIYLNWHGANKLTQLYGGGLDEYCFNGNKFIFQASYYTPEFGCGQSISKTRDNQWLWTDRVMNRIVISDEIAKSEKQ